MAKDFKLDSNNDIVTENGDYAYVEAGTETAQNANLRIKIIKGEITRSPDTGLDVERFFAVSTSFAYKELILRKIIYGTPGVREIRRFDVVFDKSDQTLYVDATVVTDDGAQIMTIQV